MITILRYPPADATRLPRQLPHPPPDSLPKPKRPAPSHIDPPTTKKPRIEGGDAPNPSSNSAPTKTRPTAKALLNQPSFQAPGNAVAALNKPTMKPVYGGIQPSTNLQVVSFGEPTRQASPDVSNSQPNQPPIKPSFHEFPRQDPPRHDPSRQKTLPQEAQDEEGAKAMDDRLYSVPPQPRSFIYRPLSKKTYSTSRSNAKANLSSQAQASTHTGLVEAERDDDQPQARPSVTANDSADAEPDLVSKRAPTVVNPPGVFSLHVYIYTSLTTYPQLNPKLRTTVPAPNLTRLLSK